MPLKMRDLHNLSEIQPLRGFSSFGPKMLVGTEPVMFLYMLCSFMKMPAFMTLLFEKACYTKFNLSDTICREDPIIKHVVQDEVNRLFTLSSLFLLIPSIFVGLFLGSLSDIWSIKFSMLISFITLVVSNVNYIIQSHLITWHAYWLLLSDLVFGLGGGFSAVIGILFAYEAKSSSENRNVKFALMEGVIGLGAAIGSISSGFIRKQVGFVGVFVIIQIILLMALLYIIIFIKDIRPPPNVDTSRSLIQSVGDRIREVAEMYANSSRDRFAHCFLNIVLIALFAEFVCFAGMSDILFQYMRLRFDWTDVEYGIFNGIGMGMPSLAVILIYPILHKKFKLSNGFLAILGLITKAINVGILAIATVGWLAMASLIFTVFVRFISTSLRSMASFYVANNEQGKLFTLIGLLQSIAFIIASPIFNGGYRETLYFYPGTMLIVIIVILITIIPFIAYIIQHPEEKRLQEEHAWRIQNNNENVNHVPD